MIAGFPGETYEDHRATMDFVEALPFTYLHVFSFSSRPGTEAARLIKQERTPQLPPAVIKQRVHELRACRNEGCRIPRCARGSNAARSYITHARRRRYGRMDRSHQR
ncbi:MAG: hypothetical protein ACRD6I_17845, partial [Candidatus Acidiferrales bacterium]